MTAGGYTYISNDESIHSSDQVEDLSLTLSETDKAVDDSSSATGENSVHANLLRNNFIKTWNSKNVFGHHNIHEDITDKNEHHTQEGERKSFSIIVIVSSDVLIV